MFYFLICISFLFKFLALWCFFRHTDLIFFGEATPCPWTRRHVELLARETSKIDQPVTWAPCEMCQRVRGRKAQSVNCHPRAWSLAQHIEVQKTEGRVGSILCGIDPILTTAGETCCSHMDLMRTAPSLSSLSVNRLTKILNSPRTRGQVY